MSIRPMALGLAAFLLLATWHSGAAGETTLGVFIRPDGIMGQSVAEVAPNLRANGVGAVFYLTTLPLAEGEEARILELKSALDPDVDLHLWLAVYRNSRYTQQHPEDAFVSDEPLSEPGWISPTSRSYEQYLLDGIRYLIDRIGPRGFLLDYFYVPFGPFDNATMAAFSAYYGANLTVSNVTTNPTALGAFLEWRNERILNTLWAIRDATRELELSVFVIMVSEQDRLARGQDLASFSGATDFLVPNTYHVVALRDASWVGDGVKVLKAIGARSVWPGIQAYEIEPKEIRKAVRSALRGGAAGVILFRYGTMTDDYWEQVGIALSPRMNSALVILPVAVVLVLAACLRWRRRAAATREEARQARAKRKHRRH